MKPAVFLDRDGTVIEEVGYLNRLDRVAFFPWSVDAVRVLNDAGLLVIVVTNQAGVARGYFDEQLVIDTHALIDERSHLQPGSDPGQDTLARASRRNSHRLLGPLGRHTNTRTCCLISPAQSRTRNTRNSTIKANPFTRVIPVQEA